MKPALVRKLSTVYCLLFTAYFTNSISRYVWCGQISCGVHDYSFAMRSGRASTVFFKLSNFRRAASLSHAGAQLSPLKMIRLCASIIFVRSVRPALLTSYSPLATAFSNLVATWSSASVIAAFRCHSAPGRLGDCPVDLQLLT